MSVLQLRRLHHESIVHWPFGFCWVFFFRFLNCHYYLLDVGIIWAIKDVQMLHRFSFSPCHMPNPPFWPTSFASAPHSYSMWELDTVNTHRLLCKIFIHNSTPFNLWHEFGQEINTYTEEAVKALDDINKNIFTILHSYHRINNTQQTMLCAQL